MATQPENPEALYLLGLIAYRVRQHPLAIQLIRQAISVHPAPPSYYHADLGVVLRANGELDQAIAHYRRALAFDPSDALTLCNFANTLCAAGQLDEAIACYRRAVERKPDFAKAHYSLGLALRAIGDLEEAVVCSRRAIEIRPNYPEAHYLLGNLLLEQGRPEEAVPSYRRSIEQDPTRLEVHYGLRAALARQGNPRRVAAAGRAEQIVREFHRLYYYTGSLLGTWRNTYWMGVPVWKSPLDLWLYQEILFSTRPDVTIECGTASGGSALFLATIYDSLGMGRVITIDIDPAKRSSIDHERITFLVGSSTSDAIFAEVKRLVGAGSAMVILDSDHTKDHVFQELTMYSQLVSVGKYLIVEDSNLGGHPVVEEFGDGPMEAIDEFLKDNAQFTIDRTMEKFYLTQNPRGYLKRGV